MNKKGVYFIDYSKFKIYLDGKKRKNIKKNKFLFC